MSTETDFPTLPAPDLAALGEREKDFWATFESSGDQNTDATAFCDWLMSQPESIEGHRRTIQGQLTLALQALEETRVAYARMETGLAIAHGGTRATAICLFARATERLMNAVRNLQDERVPTDLPTVPAVGPTLTDLIHGVSQ